MSKKFPLSLFPGELFPDVTLQTVHLTPTELTISVSQGAWELGPKLILFEGAGSMFFAYTGAPQIRWREGRAREWQYVNSTETLNYVKDLLLIYKKHTGWEFRFATDRPQHHVEVILPKVTAISWDGPGEDLEDPEE